MVVYFQFVKYMACLYFIMGVLSLPAMVFFYSGNKSNVATFNELITMVSVGNIGESPIACGEGEFGKVRVGATSTQNVGTINLQCRYGHLESMIGFGQ